VAAARGIAFVEGRTGPELVCAALARTFGSQAAIAAEAAKVREELAKEGKGRDDVNRLRAQEEDLRRRADDERDVEAALRGALLGFRDEGALDYLASTALRGTGPAEMRAAAAEALGQSARADPGILRALRAAARDSKPLVREAALAALARLLARGAEAAAEIAKGLDDARWTVRLQAARRLAGLALPESVDGILARLPRESGRVRRELADLLAALTGQKFGVEPEGWTHWWKENRAAYVSGERALVPPEDRPPPRAEGDRGAHYYGISIDSQRILFVIDISGSMEDAGSSPNASKEQEAKRELVRCVKSLAADDAFGVYAYSDTVQKWKPGIVKASAGVKEEALRWIESLSAAAWTNTYAALEEGLRISVADPRNDMGEDYGLHPDTIFLLTDGAPTGPTGRTSDAKGEPEWKRVLEGVRGWNRTKRVVIHAVGVGASINSEFLATLARENGGSFVRVK